MVGGNLQGTENHSTRERLPGVNFERAVCFDAVVGRYFPGAPQGHPVEKTGILLQVGRLAQQHRRFPAGVRSDDVSFPFGHDFARGVD
jgi:hypothetical protein